MILHWQQKLNIPLILHNQTDLSKSFLFVDATKIYPFKAKDSETKKYPLRLGNTSNNFTIDNMRKTGLKGSVKFFFCWL